MAHDVFISYSAEDKTTADAVCAALESKGVRCWVAPRDILPGMVFSEAIIGAIHASRLLVLVFSSRSNNSPHVMREVERAVSKGLPIIPFRIEDVPLSPSMEYFISTPHWLDALTPPLQKHLGHLAETVGLLLSRIEAEGIERTAAADATVALGGLLAPAATPASPEATAVIGRMKSRPAVRAGAVLAAVGVVLAVAVIAASGLRQGSPPAATPSASTPGIVVLPTPTAAFLTVEPAPTGEPRTTEGQILGDITATFAAPGDQPGGLAWDGASLWLTGSAEIFELDPAGKVLGLYSPPDYTPEGLTWDGEAFWIFATNDGEIYRFSMASSPSGDPRVLSSFHAPTRTFGATNHGLAWDGAGLWFSDSYNVYSLDRSGATLKTLTFGREVAGLAWDGGRLWLAQDAFPENATIAAADAEGNILFTVGTPLEEVDALVWGDGQLWAVGFDAETFEMTIYRIDVSGAGE